MTTAVQTPPVSLTIKPGECTASKILNNALINTVALTALSMGFWAVCGSALASPAILITLAGANIVLLGAYIYERIEELSYEVSLVTAVVQSYVFADAYPWWNEIDNGLYLGRIPLHGHGHLESLPKLGKSVAVLSLLRPFELEDHYLVTTAINHSEWEKLKIISLQIPAVDYAPVSIEHLNQAVQFIREMREQRKTVYVHCKAGVGRSATAIACYLLAEGLQNGQKFATPDDAIQYVQSKRPNVMIGNDPGRKAIVAFFHHLHQ